MAETPANPVPTPTPTPPPLSPEQLKAQADALMRQRWIIAGVVAAVIVVLVAIGFIVAALVSNPSVAQNLRDIFIIFMALESLIIGAALVVLIIQIASLINLLNNEIKPVLEATNETIATLRGTTQFLTENLVEPVVKLNSYVAGLQKMLDIFNLKK